MTKQASYTVQEIADIEGITKNQASSLVGQAKRVAKEAVGSDVAGYLSEIENAPIGQFHL